MNTAFGRLRAPARPVALAALAAFCGRGAAALAAADQKLRDAADAVNQAVGSALDAAVDAAAPVAAKAALAVDAVGGQVAAAAEAGPDMKARMAHLALQIGIILLAAKAGGLVARRLRMPPVLGELVSGMVVGPFALGRIPLPALGLPHGAFPIIPEGGMPVSPELYGVATLGSIVLLFVSGLETDLSQFLRYSVAGTVVGIGGVIASFAAGIGAGMIFIPDISGPMDPRCLFLGVLSTATSVGITARILSDKKKMDSPEGVTIMAAAVMDDVLGIIGLAIVVNLTAATAMAAPGAEHAAIQWGAIGRTAISAFGVWIGAMVLCLLFANRLAGVLKRFRSPVSFASMAAALAFIAGGLIEQAGLAMIIGGYVLGLALSKTDIAFALQERLHSLYAFLVPVFFAVMGMLVDLGGFAKREVIVFGLVFSAAAVLAKVIGCGLPALALNFNALGALRIGVGMVPRGEVALIIAGIGATTMMRHASGEVTPILDSEHFGAAIIMTLLTTVVAPPLFSLVMSGNKPGVKRVTHTQETLETSFPLPTARLTELVFDKLVALFRTEGYFVSSIDNEWEYRMAKERSSFTLSRHHTTLVFHSLPSEVSFIRFAVTEAVADLRQSLEFLHEYVVPEPMDYDARGKPTPLPRRSGRFLREGPASSSSASARTQTPPVAPPASAAPAGAITPSGTDLPQPAERSPLPGLAAFFGTVLTPECVSLDLSARNKEEAIEELVALLAERGRLPEPDRTLAAIKEREQASPTGLERGVALPHARTDAVREAVAAVGLSRRGLDFGAHDGKPSKLVVLLVSPRTNTSPHLAFITALATRLKQFEDMDALLRVETPMELLSRLTGGEPVKSHHRVWKRLYKDKDAGGRG